MNITCAILAGGSSSRIGRDKATIMINGKSLIRHVFEKIQELFQEIVIVSSNHSGFTDINVPVINDILPVRSPMVGIVSALLYSSNPYIFVCACDMPFLHKKTIKYMVDKIGGEDIIIPKTEKGFEPLCALYNRACIPHMLKSVGCNELKIAGVFPSLNVKILDDNPSFYYNGNSVFTNINTLKDLNQLTEHNFQLPAA